MQETYIDCFVFSSDNITSVGFGPMVALRVGKTLYKSFGLVLWREGTEKKS